MRSIVNLRPLILDLQTCSVCNARCVFCARQKLPQAKELMSIDLFKRICFEYAAMGGGYLGFSPLLADPLLDPLLLERIEIAKKNFSKISMYLFTNGIALPNFSDDQLIEVITRLKLINISLGGLTRDEYKVMMGVDQFKTVWGSLERLSRINQKLGGVCKLILHIRTHRRQETINSPALAKLEELGYDCSDIMDAFSDWDGLVTENDLPKGAAMIKRNNTRCKVPCLIPMSHMMIMPDGRILACGCIDAKESTRVGHLDHSTLLEIWRGSGLKAFRDSFIYGNLYSVCWSCRYYKNYEIVFSRTGFRNFNPSQNLWECV
ncbi:MAG: SPASM domain-containing protein [Candidatus Omnitrophota bacterium]|nr:SPASM domain-containing protein [Candidatus Omnitrophota bacterium]